MRVSALSMTHNRVELFIETIHSVLNQSYPVHEFIVIDDGSTENIKEVIDKFNDPRIRYFYYERIGLLPVLRNIALSKASGDYVAFIDSDDLWHKDKIKRHVEAMSLSGAVMSFSDCRMFNEDGPFGPPVCEAMEKPVPDIFREIVYRRQSLAFGSNLFFTRMIDGRVPKFDERQYTGDHDFVLMTCSRYKAIYIDEVLNYIRRHRGNMSADNSILEIVCPLEYNRTLGKLLKQKKISVWTYRRIKASNYARAGVAYLKRRRFRTSTRYLVAGLCLYPCGSYFRILCKVLWRRLAAQNTSMSAN